MDSRPLYAQLVGAVLDMIDEQGMVAGDALPTEAELARLFDVGRSTVREAMTYLNHEGIVERTQGSRTVLKAMVGMPTLGLETLESFETLANRQGWTCATSSVTIAAQVASREQSEHLEIDEGDSITLVTRIKTKDGDPIAVMESVVASSLVTTEEIRRDFESSITDMMSDQFPLQFATATVTAVATPPELAQDLAVAVGTPLTLLEEHFIGEDAIVLAWNRNYVVPGSLRLEMLRRVPTGLAQQWRYERGADS